MDPAAISVLVVDDDPGAREVLRVHLETIPGIRLLGMAASATEAYRLILELNPDMVFLDVEMPGKTGFDLLGDLQTLNLHPCIVFQTAYDKYAINAIKHAAFDYLLKPVDRGELLASVARYRANRNHELLGSRIEKLFSRLHQTEKLRFNTRQGFTMIDPGEIVFLQADWNYTEVWLDKEKKEVVTINIGKVEEMLASLSFSRISRSVIINTRYIDKLNRPSRIVTLKKGDELFEFRVSRTYLRNLE